MNKHNREWLRTGKADALLGAFRGYNFDEWQQRHVGFVARLCWAGVAAGAGLRLWQFAAGPAMWLDELAVARNVTQRSLTDLMTRPLSWDQSAPKGLSRFGKTFDACFRRERLRFASLRGVTSAD